MRIRPHHHAMEATFDLTPMVDVVLLLIIFFTLTSQFSHVSIAPIDLPREKGERDAGTPSPFVLILDVARDGVISIDGDAHDPASLASLLASEARRAGGPDGLEIVVRADRMVPAARLDPLVGVLSSAGVTKWKLATSGQGAGQPSGREGGAR